MISTHANKQAGFSHVVGLVLVVAAFSIIGFIGYRLYAHPQSKTGSSASSQSGTQVNDGLTSRSAPKITTASDLDQAGAVLDQIDTASEAANDSAQLDKQLGGF